MVSARAALAREGCAEGPAGAWSALTVPQPAPAQYRRDSTIYILKLVHNPECHHNLVMRPGILPISKTRLKSHDLEFPGKAISPAFSHKE